jgi:hypothetical protein
MQHYNIPHQLPVNNRNENFQLRSTFEYWQTTLQGLQVQGITLATLDRAPQHALVITRPLQQVK